MATGIFSGAMPMPLSVTTMRQPPFSSLRARTVDPAIRRA